MNILEKIQEHILSNKLEEAISELLTFAKSNKGIKNDLILIRAQLKDLEQEDIRGVLNYEKICNKRNEIRINILRIANYLHEDETKNLKIITQDSGNEGIKGYFFPQLDCDRFVGRKEELEKLKRLLSPKHQSWVISIDGIGGIGKSTLALKIADIYLRDFAKIPEEERFQYIIWTSAKQIALTGNGLIQKSAKCRVLEDIFTRIAVTMEREDIIRFDSAIQNLLIHKVLTKYRTLIIIDNFETIDDQRILDFIYDVPRPTKVIVTTRHRIDVAYPIRLVGMKKEEAINLMNSEASRKNIKIGLDDMLELYRKTGGIPLAMVWGISQVSAGYCIRTILSGLGATHNDAIKFCFGEVMKSVSDKPSYKILLALSLFSTSASRDALGKIAGFGTDEVGRDDALVELEKLSLIDKNNDRFSMLPIVSSFVGKELQNLGYERETYIEDWINYFLDFVKNRCRTNIESLNDITEEYDNIEQVIIWLSVKKPQVKKLVELLSSMQGFLLAKGYWNDWQSWLEKLRYVASVENDEFSRAFSLNRLGLLNVLRRNSEKASSFLEQALDIFKIYGDTVEVFRTEIDLCRVRMFEDNYKKAWLLLKHLDNLAEQIEIPELRGLLHIRKSEWYTEQGIEDKKTGKTKDAQRKFEKARQNLFSALDIHGEKIKTFGLNLIYWRLGVVFLEEERYNQANVYLQLSRNIARYLQISNGVAFATAWLARLKEKTNESMEAEMLALDAKERFARLQMTSHELEMNKLLERLRVQNAV